MTLRTFCRAWVLCLPFLVSGSAHAATDDLRAAALVRALAYDDTLAKRAGARVVLGVLHDDSTASGPMRARLQGLAGVTVQGRPLAVVELAYVDAATLRTAIAGEKISVLYVARGLHAKLDAIVAVTREFKVTSMTTDEDLVKRGVSLGAIDVAGSAKPRLVVNLAASRLEGMELRPELLRVVQVINN